MNIYMLMEGSRSEPIIYDAWIKYLSPNMTRVYDLNLIDDDKFYITSSDGYPRIVTHSIRASIQDINATPNIDAFWIVVDSEDSTIEQREEIIQSELSKFSLNRPIDIQIIVQKCCIETWGFGNDKVFPNNNIDAELQDYLNFYDIRVNDPEEMKYPNSYDGSIASYHLHYLKKILRMRRISYAKNKPNDLDKGYYFDEICARSNTTSHLRTFTKLKNLLEETF
ncbi:MAG: hypothetical protein KA277_11525 [Fusobacteriaceae bacterium]|jgi:hypothetical protein|uniref:hypothetical protein n=1 Tax=Acinetobacter sp. TaxID=472 RepID=UPI001B510943|nr:hypothetical protein [Acinetobacter sp.]MBP6468631.1 hypothetical protein [Fusobacteriaceae bacterium]MDD2947092.1 hypothetical protein [Acinetobacter sp.]